VTSLVRSGHLLLTTNGAAGDLDLTARRLDLSTMNLSGDRVVLASGVTSQFTASQNGILAYAHGGLATEELVWVDDRGGVAAPVMPRARLTNFDLSKDDRMIAIQEPEGLRVHDLQRGVTTVLAAGSGVDPVWSPDGREVAYAISAAPDRGVYVMPAFGGPARRIYTRDVATYLDDWSRDGKWLAAHSNLPNDGLLIPLDPALEPIPFGSATAKSAVDEGRFSPDANWLAYGLTSAEGGDVFLMPVPPTGPRWQVSVSGGAQPRWSGDGRSLFFLAPDGLLMKVDVDAKPGAIPNLSAPRALFQTGIRVVLNLDQFAVSRDGTRFLLRRPESGAATEDIRVIVNWPALLKGDSK
jgi:hypothetical protein